MPVIYETRPLSFFRSDPGQPRRYFSEAELRPLGESMRDQGQLQPVGARPDGTLLWGERRYRAALLVGLPALTAAITDDPLTESEVRLRQVAENVHRADLADAEKWRACAELLRLNPGWTQKDLAAALHLGESTITKYLAPAKCVAAVQAALEEGRIGIGACYELSRVPAAEQPYLLGQVLAGTTRDGLARRVRERKPKPLAAVRVRRLVCPLPGGVTLTLSGGELSLDEAVEALGEAAREMRRARDLGYTARTFAAAMTDRAAKAAE